MNKPKSSEGKGIKSRIVKPDNYDLLVRYLKNKMRFTGSDNNFMEYKVSKIFGKKEAINVALEKAKDIYGCITLLPSGFLSIKNDEYLFLFWNYKCLIIDDDDSSYPHHFTCSDNPHNSNVGTYKFTIKLINHPTHH